MPAYLKFLLAQIAKLFTLSLLFRLFFYFRFLNDMAFKDSELARAWYIGLKFDMRYVLIALIPFALFTLVFRNKIFSGFPKKIARFYLLFIFTLSVMIYLLDLGHFSYLGTRVNSAVFRFFSNPLISIQMIWESYPVIWGTAGVLTFIFVLNRILTVEFNSFSKQVKSETRKGFIFRTVLTVLLFASGIYGAFAFYPLRWSEAMFSQNHLISGFALNPEMNLIDTYRFKDTRFDPEKLKSDFKVIAGYLGIKQTDTLDFRRPIHGLPDGKRPNIVFVMLESMGSSKMGLHGEPMKATPVMDSLALHGRFFPNFFVPAVGTARTVFTSITGIPDISVNKTLSRNQFVIDQRVIFNDFKGYDKYYMIGGSADWANIRAVFENNIENLKLYEEGDYKAEDHADVWGLTDYDLFYEADKILRKQHQTGRPFIAYIQTASNHLPYTIGKSENNEFHELRAEEIDKTRFAKSSYPDYKQYNSVRYLDYNIGKFMERARKSGYLKNTIFIFFGDHDARAKKYTFEEADWYTLGLRRFRTTCFMYGPGIIKPEIDSLPTNLMDLMPTAASYTGDDFTNYTLGFDLNDKAGSKNRKAFFFDKFLLNSYGLFDGEYALFKDLNTNAYSLKIIGEDPEKDFYPDLRNEKKLVELQKLLEAYYESIRYLMLNNKKIKN